MAALDSISEFETAVRCRLPFVAVVGNDGCWNAERQIPLKSYNAAVGILLH